jgi:anthranilate phosphoribosyltransferase
MASAEPESGGDSDAPTGYLPRLRLVAALDALLVEGSVTKAAARLAQIRAIYNDPILVRTGRGMSPTPLAERLRLRVRAVVAEAERLLDTDLLASEEPVAPAPHAPADVEPPSPSLNMLAPLAMRPAMLLEGQPDPDAVAGRLAKLASDAEPRRQLASYIALIGGGVGGARPLDQTEAEAAFSIILAGDADPVQIGALLIAMQARNVTVTELAGLVAASRSHIGALPLGSSIADLDIPAYVSPKLTSAPWFLHATRLIAAAGHRVLIHGQSGGSDRLNTAIRMAGLPTYQSIDEARTSLERHRIGFVPLSALSPQIQALTDLYGLIEMRSPLNLLVSLLNPLGASASLIGGSTFAGRGLLRDTAAVLGWSDLTAITTHRDVAQSTPFRSTPLLRLAAGVPREVRVPAIHEKRSQAPVGYSGLEYWQAVWEGGARDERARHIIVATAATALMTLDARLTYAEALSRADMLWSNRTLGDPAHR